MQRFAARRLPTRVMVMVLALTGAIAAPAVSAAASPPEAVDAWAVGASTGVASPHTGTGVQLARGGALVDMSVDGRYVLFASSSPEPVPGEGANPYTHLYRRDLWTGRTELVDVSSSGEPANGYVYNTQRMSANGGFVVFPTSAGNLTPDSPTDGGLFLRDLGRHVTEYLDLKGVGGRSLIAPWATGVSPDGRYVVFRATDPDLPATATQSGRRIYVYDRQRLDLRVLLDVPPESMAPGWITYTDPALRFVGFNLYETTDSPTPGARHWVAIIRDLQDGTDRRVTGTIDGQPPNADTYVDGITPDGQMLFDSAATNLVPNDTPGSSDTFVADTRNGTVRRISVADDDPSVSGGVGSSISLTGRFVTFSSTVASLTPDDPDAVRDVFIRDTVTGTLSRVTPPVQGQDTEPNVMASMVSVTGRFVAFDSYRGSLVPDDTNGVRDVFVRDLWTGKTTRVSVF